MDSSDKFFSPFQPYSNFSLFITSVNITHRCDGKIHCKDKSDEINCQIFETDAAYLKATPPPSQGKLI